MNWLPPTYRLIYSKEFDKIGYTFEFVKQVEAVLNSYIDNNSLFCSLYGNIIAMVENIEIKDNKFCFWINEIKPNIFEKNNVHLNSFYIKIELDRELRDISISSILKLERINED